ncbi:peptidoglycan-binding protein [uncultured Cohaesibacter sp.]|uniref:peptidoglycan-binding protein n=1 Tax=uncultured Cohaesibacter sp. TaxID=1002546 RepID=UPI0029308632|nr:peptidoglycan-binding protein [uncultured Cohaesibacter sp.]
MIDERFRTDREIGEYFESQRNPDREHQRGGQPLSQYGSGSNAALLDAISDIESQLHALASRSGMMQDDRFADDESRFADHPRSQPGSSSHRRSETARKKDGNYRNALERIEAQLQRVDTALEKQTGKQTDWRSARSDTREGSRYAAHTDAVSRDSSPMSQQRTVSSTSVLAHGDFDSAMRQIMERSRTINEEVADTAKASLSEVTRTARETLGSAQDYKVALDKLSKLQSQDDSLIMLREDVSALRSLLEQANMKGASEQVLNEIAALSGRIEQLSTTISETRQDPHLIETMTEIRSLLDRPALDPSIDKHFGHILSKLDGLKVGDHKKDFVKLSEQLDHLRDILSTQPQVQHLTSMSGQMNQLIERLASLEDHVRHEGEQSVILEQQQGLEKRLAQMQAMMERLDPSDRLRRLEDQLSHFADRLEDSSGQGDIHKPLEALARQVESLVGLMDQQDQGNQSAALSALSERVSSLDRHILEQRSQQESKTDHRFDQVEQTLARIDDMLANRMGSSNISSLELSLSRIADRMEAQEEMLRTVPAIATAEKTREATDILGQLEHKIADLADRLDDASRITDDQQFFEMLTSRLDDLTQQFANSQSRFDAVDRLGADIRELAQKSLRGSINETEIAEQAAFKALQKVGPISVGSDGGAIEAIIDGLKDDLHGLRQFAESSDTSTQQGLNSVSKMLNGIVDRLGMLEDQVRENEDHSRDLDNRDDERGPTVRIPQGPEASEPSGERVQTKPLTAAQMLKRRGKDSATGRQAPPVQAQAARAQAQPAPQTSGDGRQPGIVLSGKAVSLAENDRPTAGPQAQSQSAMAAPVQPQSVGNAALKEMAQPTPTRQPRGARVVDAGNGPDRQAGEDLGTSKADFIAAARRAAQAAARESEKVEKEQGEATGFLARFKGSKKSPEAQQPAAPKKQTARANLEGMNRKERRAAITEAARMAKMNKRDKISGEVEPELSVEETAVQMIEEGEGPEGLLAKLKSTFSRHSRPLLMAAAAIVLAITTLQLINNPESSLHGLFKGNSAKNLINPQPVSPSKLPAANPSANDGKGQAPTVGDQSSLTPAAGTLVAPASGDEAAKAVAFTKPSGVEGPFSTPRTGSPLPQTASVGTQMNDQGVDLTPTSSISSGGLPTPTASAAKSQRQPLPPVLNETPDGGSAAVSPSIEAALETNKMFSPGITNSPLLEAASSGNALAQFEVARRLTVGDGMSVDLKEAAKWFERAANQSMPQAQYSLANLYEKGNGVKKDLQVARLWYERAADLGNVKSMHNLAVLYAEGGLGKPDFAKASHWFLMAADHGLKDSQYNLAILFARGMGVKQDLLQSYKWFAIAAAQGDKGAEAKRDEVLAVLKPAQQKAAKALVAAWSPKHAKPSANTLAEIPEEWRIAAPKTSDLSKASDNPQSGFVVSRALIAKTQSMLGALGYNAGPSDGQMGPRTRTAIRNFQEIAGLQVTGQIDPALLDALSQRSL